MARAAANERSPWQWCDDCPTCKRWSGWQCLDEPTGFRNCASYGKTWHMQVIAKDAKTGRAKMVQLKKGQTIEDLTRPPQEKTRAPSRPSGGVNLFDF